MCGHQNVSALAAASGSVKCGYDPIVGPGKVVDGVTFTRFNADDEEVTSDADDVCGKRQSSCECRFGENNELKFGGYPGIGTFFGDLARHSTARR